jgi:uncharacterized protein YcbK (DUF882 family)
MPTLLPHSGSVKTGLSRRNFIKFLVCSGVISYSSKFAFAALDGIALKERSLSLFNPHTKERFEGIYWCDGDYVPSALNNINHLMRDIRTNDVKLIDTHLLDLIFSISTKLKPKTPFRVISGYRSLKTNTLLRKRGNGAAKKSYHIKGQAVDIRLPGYKTSVLRRAAFELKKGGVGYYPKRRFVHIDVGPVRYWAEKNK